MSTDYYNPNNYVCSTVAEAIYDNESQADFELSFKVGDLLTVLACEPEGFQGWWICVKDGVKGIAPAMSLVLIDQNLYPQPIVKINTNKVNETTTISTTSATTMSSSCTLDVDNDDYFVPRNIDEGVSVGGGEGGGEEGRGLELSEYENTTMCHDDYYESSSTSTAPTPTPTSALQQMQINEEDHLNHLMTSIQPQKQQQQQRESKDCLVEEYEMTYKDYIEGGGGSSSITSDYSSQSDETYSILPPPPPPPQTPTPTTQSQIQPTTTTTPFCPQIPPQFHPFHPLHRLRAAHENDLIEQSRRLSLGSENMIGLQQHHRKGSDSPSSTRTLTSTTSLAYTSTTAAAAGTTNMNNNMRNRHELLSAIARSSSQDGIVLNTRAKSLQKLQQLNERFCNANKSLVQFLHCTWKTEANLILHLPNFQFTCQQVVMALLDFMAFCKEVVSNATYPGAVDRITPKRIWQHLRPLEDLCKQITDEMELLNNNYQWNPMEIAKICCNPQTDSLGHIVQHVRDCAIDVRSLETTIKGNADYLFPMNSPPVGIHLPTKMSSATSVDSVSSAASPASASSSSLVQFSEFSQQMELLSMELSTILQSLTTIQSIENQFKQSKLAIKKATELVKTSHQLCAQMEPTTTQGQVKKLLEKCGFDLVENLKEFIEETKNLFRSSGGGGAGREESATVSMINSNNNSNKLEFLSKKIILHSQKLVNLVKTL